MKQYYENEHGFKIYEIKEIKSPRLDDPAFGGYKQCEACGCYGGRTFAVLINQADIDKARYLQFYAFKTEAKSLQNPMTNEGKLQAFYARFKTYTGSESIGLTWA